MDIVEYNPLSYKTHFFGPHSYKEVADLFHGAIHSIDTAIYSQAQLEAWAPSPIDYQHWKSRLELKKPFIAIIENTMAGFIELESDGHIDCLYVHKDFQRQGVATKLLNYISDIAKKKNIRELHLEASKIAKPFFESFEFTTISEHQVHIGNITLTNYKMIGKPTSIK